MGVSGLGSVDVDTYSADGGRKSDEIDAPPALGCQELNSAFLLRDSFLLACLTSPVVV